MNNEINSGESLLNQKKSAFLPISVYITIFIFIIFFVFFYFFSFLPISGDSMENTIHDKEYCFIQRKCFTVSRGDIVTINTAKSNEKEHLIIKRVVGTAGDKLMFMISEDRYYVDIYICESGNKHFRKLNEPYIKELMRRTSVSFNNDHIKGANDETITLLQYTPNLTEIDISDQQLLQQLSPYIIDIPKNEFYFLGDNRNTSRDGRYYGTRNIDSITSKIIFVL